MPTGIIDTDSKLPVYYIRHNLKHDLLVGQFYKENQVAIHILSPEEKEDWGNFISKVPTRMQIVSRWATLCKNVEESNILIVANYKNNNKTKIGIIKKQSQFFELDEDTGYKIFQLSEIEEIEKDDTQIFNALIPHSVTISPLKKRLPFIRSKYYKLSLDIILDNLSEKSIELICLEWLRSNCAKERKLKYQLLLAGGNLPKIDILGSTVAGNKLAAQVSYTDDNSTIKKKKESLKRFKSDIKILFCTLNSQLDGDIEIISLQEVWDDLKNDYSDMLKSLVEE